MEAPSHYEVDEARMLYKLSLNGLQNTTDADVRYWILGAEAKRFKYQYIFKNVFSVVHNDTYT